MIGSYLVVRVDGEDIAETTSVSLKVKARRLDTTTQDSGINESVTSGKVMIRISGSFLYTNNWDTLFTYLNDRSEVSIAYLRNGVEFFTGYGIFRRLSARNSDRKKGVTGSYSIRYRYSATPGSTAITTESGFKITTESGETLIIE